jgi:hypothetical protein
MLDKWMGSPVIGRRADPDDFYPLSGIVQNARIQFAAFIWRTYMADLYS